MVKKKLNNNNKNKMVNKNNRSPSKRIKQEIMSFFYRPSKVVAYYPTNETESTSTYYVHNQSINSTRKAHKIINVVSKEQIWHSEKWKTINILDDLRINYNKNASLIDKFYSQYVKIKLEMFIAGNVILVMSVTLF